MKYVILALATLLSVPAFADATNSYSCHTGGGIEISWAALDGATNSAGDMIGTTLYKNRVEISFNEVNVEFKPRRSLTLGNTAALAAFSRDGQEYVIVNADYKLENPENEPIEQFKGTVNFRVKTKNGYIQRKHTDVNCSMVGEG